MIFSIVVSISHRASPSEGLSTMKTEMSRTSDALNVDVTTSGLLSSWVTLLEDLAYLDTHERENDSFFLRCHYAHVRWSLTNGDESDVLCMVSICERLTLMARSHKETGNQIVQYRRSICIFGGLCQQQVKTVEGLDLDIRQRSPLTTRVCGADTSIKYPWAPCMIDSKMGTHRSRNVEGLSLLWTGISWTRYIHIGDFHALRGRELSLCIC